MNRLRDCSSMSEYYRVGLRPKNRFVPSITEAYTLSQSGTILEGAMKADGAKKHILGCSMLLGSLVGLLAFSTLIAAQSGGDPAKAQMQEMTRREIQLNSLGEDK